MGHKSNCEEPDTHATDVSGIKPTIIDLAETPISRKLGRALLKVKTRLDSEGRLGVTLLYDRYKCCYDFTF